MQIKFPFEKHKNGDGLCFTVVIKCGSRIKEKKDEAEYKLGPENKDTGVSSGFPPLTIYGHTISGILCGARSG